jgi:hypothetical protein
MRLDERLAEEPLRYGRVPLRRQQEVDRLPEAVDPPIQVGPDALDLDVDLVKPPGPGARPQVPPDPLFQFGGVGLHQRNRVVWSTTTPRSDSMEARL